jgi:hypothetical protein
VAVEDILERLVILSSLFPLVELDSPAPPEPGRHYPTPKLCHKVFRRGECAQFYSSLKDSSGRHQCPYGFSTWPIRVGSKRLAVTALVGAPRLGGEPERLRGKEYPANRVAADSVPEWAGAVHGVVVTGDVEREAEFTRRLEALHEIRRFNQIVKINMERACNDESPDDPDSAKVELVRAHRASGNPTRRHARGDGNYEDRTRHDVAGVRRRAGSISPIRRRRPPDSFRSARHALAGSDSSFKTRLVLVQSSKRHIRLHAIPLRYRLRRSVSFR